MQKHQQHKRRFQRPERDITFFCSDYVERQTCQPIAEEAERRGFAVRFSGNFKEKAEIGFYLAHAPHTRALRPKVAFVMLHDLAQRHDIWPYFWKHENWNYCTAGFLPGEMWANLWRQSKEFPEAWPSHGVYVTGWPKADVLFQKDQDRGAMAQLKAELDLPYPVSILYAPSWENDDKQVEFVEAALQLPANLLIKQAPWNPATFPGQVQIIKAMAKLHTNYAPHVKVINPGVNIMTCLGISDVIVSDESSCMVEALLCGIPSVAVTDWIIPTPPPRHAIFPFDFPVKTPKAELGQTLKTVTENLEHYKQGLLKHRDMIFSHLGNSASITMDVVEAIISEETPPIAPLQ